MKNRLKSLERFFVLYIVMVIIFFFLLIFALFLNKEEKSLRMANIIILRKENRLDLFVQNLHKIEYKVQEYNIRKLYKEQAYINLYEFIEYLKKNYNIKIQKAPYEKDNNIYAIASLNYKYTSMEDMRNLFYKLLNSVVPLVDLTHIEQRLTTEGTILKIEMVLIQPFRESK